MKKIKVGGHTVKLVHRELESSSGTFDSHALTITIDPTFPPSVQGATFIHEILHALNPTLDDTPLGHALIESLAEQLWQVLSDNKLIDERKICITTKRLPKR
jgi:hypothetical protein